MTRPALCLLAAIALLLARRRPAWRPFAHSLAALACIDLARLWTSPLAQARAAPWWQVDVALVALWPGVLAVGLAAKGASERVQPRRREADGPRIDLGRLAQDPRRHPHLIGDAHAPILPRLALLAGFALALGAARPWLPRLAYLCALREPRWALAALWAEAVVRLKDEGPEPKPEPLPAGSREESPRLAPPRGPREEHAPSARLAQACALILAGCNAADLIAGAWLVPPWEAPAWGLARAVTWAAYGAVACVMGWAWWKG